MYKKILALIIFISLCGAGALAVFAADQIKTTTTFIGNSTAPLSASTNFPFSFYIGDNLSGITNPIKSAAVSISGTYTGNGTLAVSIDSDPATTQTFTLPNAGATPTPFEFLYKDPSGKINPISGGTYSYTLNIVPSGITIYSFGAELKESHRYKPTTCGGFSPFGILESSVFDTGVANGAGYNSILWQGLIASGKVKFQLATSSSPSGPWSYYGPACSTGANDEYDIAADTPTEVGCPATHNNKRYFRYKIKICSSTDCVTAGATTPQVNDVIINWAP